MGHLCIIHPLCRNWTITHEVVVLIMLVCKCTSYVAHNLSKEACRLQATLQFLFEMLSTWPVSNDMLGSRSCRLRDSREGHELG
jgi:hypothetical protein